MEENNYSVYVHTNKLNNKKYVGLTKKRPKDRWQRGNGYTHSIYFYSAIQKYGWDGFYHDVVADCLSKEEASTLERELIKEYKTTNRIYGYNLNQGGFVGGNTNHSTREKLSILNKGKNNPMYGRIGCNSARARRVLQIDPDTKDIVGVWDYIKQVEDELYYNRRNISACCKGKRKTSNGYIWQYLGEPHPYVPTSRNRAVYQIDKNTNEIIKKFNSIKEAKLAINYNGAGISACCKHSRITAGGYKWQYVDEHEGRVA